MTMMSTNTSARSYQERWTAIRTLPPSGQAETMKAIDGEGNVAFVKVLLKQEDSERRARMYREIVALRKIDAPEIPRLIESNADYHEDGDYRLFIATEFVEGQNLQEAVSAGSISPTLAIKFTISLLRTLAIAHLQGIYHRDIKPENIIVRSAADGICPVLVDFGMASIDDLEDDFRSGRGEEIGNRFLRLPEFSAGLRNKNDRRSDITFCVGLLFFMLTKEYPRVIVDGNDRFPQQRPKQRSAIRATGLDEDKVLRILDRGFQRDIARRYQTTEELLRDLKQLLKVENTSGERVNISAILERLGTASELNKVDNLDQMTNLTLQIGRIVGAMSSASGGLLEHVQTGYERGATGVKSEHGLRLVTDKSKEFMGNFAIAPHGDEFIITIEGVGMKRAYVRIPAGTTIGEDAEATIQQFVTDGLDHVLSPRKLAATERDRVRIKEMAIEHANRMLASMSNAVSSLVASPESDLVMVSPSTPGGARLELSGVVVGQTMLLSRSRNHELYVRFNCFVRIILANNIDDILHMRNDQTIMVTATQAETGGGPSKTISMLGTSMEPLVPGDELTGAVSYVLESSVRES